MRTAVIPAIIGIVVSIFAGLATTWYIGFLTGVSSSIAIEEYQKRTGTGVYDKKDAWATAAGSVVGTGLLLATLYLLKGM